MGAYSELWLAIKGLSLGEFIGLYFLLSLWFGRGQSYVNVVVNEELKKRSVK